MRPSLVLAVMARKRDDAFILGAETLEPEVAETPAQRETSEPGQRNAFAVAPEPAPEEQAAAGRSSVESFAQR